MKKVVSLLLLVVLCLGLCACENSGGASLGTAVWEKAYYLDAFNDPTEEYYIGTAKRLSGSYSSDSVTDGKLEAELRVDAEKISVFLYENGTDLVKNGDQSSIAFSVQMKAADGSKTQLYGEMVSGGACVEIWEEQARSVLHFADSRQTDNPVAAALCAKNGEVSFYLTREDQPATSYLFTVKTGNFAALYEAEIVPPIQEAAYAKAEALLAQNEYDGAMSWFTALGDYRDSPARAEEADAAKTEAMNAAQYAQAEALLKQKDFDGAIAAFTALGDYRDSAQRVREAAEKQEELRALRIEKGQPIAAGGSHTVGLKADGTVVAVGWNKFGQCEVSGWTDIRLP